MKIKNISYFLCLIKIIVSVLSDNMSYVFVKFCLIKTFSKSRVETRDEYQIQVQLDTGVSHIW